MLRLNFLFSVSLINAIIVSNSVIVSYSASQCTKVGFTNFPSGGFTIGEKLVNPTSAMVQLDAIYVRFWLNELQASNLFSVKLVRLAVRN